MKKTAIFGLLFLQIALLLYPCAPVQAAAFVPITAPSAILIDNSSHRVVYSKTPHMKRAPASTTKVLTAIIVVEHLDLNRVVTVPSFVTAIEPSKCYLKPGERYRIRDLIKATLISSANDASETLAYAAAGSRWEFSKLMNKKVRQIGARHSNFVRASGLPAKNQYSTAYDLALIMREAGRYPFLVETLKIKQCSIYSLSGRKIHLKNHNKMLWRDSREILGKTGWTRSARHCFVGRIKASGKSMFVAMLGSRSLWKDLKKLVDSQFGRSISSFPKKEKIQSNYETKKIQIALKRKGYFRGPVTGHYGPLTRAAVKRFQSAQGLHADGIAGNSTRRILKLSS